MASIFSSQPTDKILEKALDGNRISPEEALTLYREGDHLKIMATARTLREKILPHTYASYTMFRVVNYTNYCNVECSFCSFMDEIGNGKGYVLSAEEILEKMDYAVGEGADQMFLQGGVYPDLPFDYYLNVISSVKKKYPDMHIRAFSPVEIINLEKITGLPLKEVLQILKQAGLDSVPGAGAEILTDRMRNIISTEKSDHGRMGARDGNLSRSRTSGKREHRIRLGRNAGRSDRTSKRCAKSPRSHRRILILYPLDLSTADKTF